MGKGRDIVLRVDIQRAATKRQILGICSSHIMLIGLPSIMFSSNLTCSPKIQPLDPCCLHYLESPFYLLSPLVPLSPCHFCYFSSGLYYPTYPCPTCHEAFRVCNMLIYITNCSILPMFILICFLTIAWLLMQPLCSPILLDVAPQCRAFSCAP